MTRPRRARRLLFAATACLLGGVLVSVAVAVGFALWGTAQPRRWEQMKWAMEDEAAKPWAWAFGRLPQHGTALKFPRSSVGISDANIAVSPVEKRFDGPCYAWLHRTGWPMRAFEYRHVGDVAVSWPENRSGWLAPAWLARSEYEPGRPGGRPPVPLRPNPFGLAVDSAFYGGLVFACVMLGPSRRAIRRRRGLCPSCGYSRAGLAAGAACPECGAKLS